ncbi:MAG: hypothetical protein AB8G26_15200 [Ilumatobacter sp.]
MLDLFGDTTLGTEVAELEALFLFEVATLSVGGGIANELTGLSQVGTLGVQDTAVGLPDSITIGDFLVADTEVEAAKDLTITGQWSLQDGASIDVAGDVVLGPGAKVDVASTNGSELAQVLIEGAAELDGTLSVAIAESVTALPFVEWASSTGSFDSTELTGAGAAGTELIVGATGISIEPVVTGPNALSVFGFDVRDGLGDVDLLLGWPEFDGAASYAVLRDGESVANVATPFADLTSDAKQTDTWSVLALDGGGDEIGLVGSLDVFADVNGCDAVWTGAISDAWDEPLNWAPVTSGGALPAQSVPGALDLVCVFVDENLPIQVTTDVTTGALFSFVQSTDGIGLADDVVALEVSGAEFGAVAEIITSNVTATNAVLDSDGVFELSGDLVLDGSTVRLAGDLAIGGALRVLDNESVLDADPDAPRSVTADLATVTGTSFLIDDDIAFDANRIELDDSTVGGAVSLDARELIALAGESAVGSTGASFDEVIVEAGARLVTESLGAIAATEFLVRGRLDLLSPGGELGGLTVEGGAAAVVVDGGQDNALTGVKTITNLSVDDARLEFDGSLTTRRTNLINGEIAVNDRFDTAEVLSLGVSRIEAPAVALIADPEGIFDPRIITSTSVDSTLTITGDLALRSDSGITIALESIPAAPLLDVGGEVALAGDINVSVETLLPAGTEQSLIAWSTSTGTATNQLFGTNAADAGLRTTASGLVLASAVPAAPALVAYGIELGEKDEDPLSVSLAWPMLDGALSYEVFVDGVMVSTSVRASAHVLVPAGSVGDVAVVGSDDGKPLGTVGTISILTLPGCGFAWTGAISDEWDEPFNWVPVVSDGESLPPVEVPGPGDRGCIGVSTNLPVQVAADVTVESLWSIDDEFGPFGLPSETEVVAVADAELEVSEVALLSSVSLDDATLSIGAGGSVFGNVTFDGGTVEFGGSLNIDGTVTANGPTDRLTSTSGDSVEIEIDELIADTTTLVIGSGIDATIDRIQLDGSEVNGGGATTVATIETVGGASQLGFTSLSAGIIDVAADTQLAVLSIGRLDNSELTVVGRLALPATVEQIGSLELDGADAAITFGTGRENVLTGVASIGFLAVAANALSASGPLDVGTLLLGAADLDVDGTLTANSIATTGSTEIQATQTIIEDDGIATPGISTGNSGGDSVLAITGDLVLPATGETFLILDELPTAPLITVTGAATLAGEVTVSIEEDADDGTDLGLVRWGSATGTLNANVTGAGADTASLLQRDAGLFLTSRDISECGDAPRLADMAVDGCWVDQGDDTYTASRTDNVDGVAIGGVDLVLLDDDSVVTIDTENNTIRTPDPDDEPTPVAVSVPVTDGADEVARIGLGTLSFDGFQIGDSLSLSLDNLFGLPVSGTPTLRSEGGGWRFQLGLDLSGLLSTVGSLDISVGEVGILSTDLSFDDLSAVLGDLAGIVDLDIDWLDASTWSFSSIDVGGPSVTGDIDFDELDGGGTLSVRDLRVDDVLVLPDFDLTGVFTDTTRTWAASQPAPSVLRSVGFAYTTDGELLSAEILLGDEAGGASRGSVASWGEWLDIDSFDVTWDGIAKIWRVDGRLTSPDVAITGRYQADGDGGTELFELGIDGAELGPFATFDLDLVYDGSGDADVYTASTVITRDDAPDIDGGGVFTFVDGDLDTASLTFESIEIGELIAIDDFTFTYVREDGRFRLSGDLVGPDGDNSIAGSLTFDGGKLREGELRLDSLELGPVRFDELSFGFARTVGDERITSATISGNVQAGSRPATPVTGGIEFVDGDLTLLDLQVGTIDLGGIAQIENATFGYATNDDGTATVGGSGRLVTSDGATDSPVLVELTLRDGRVVDGRIEADVLSFGRALTIENLALVNSPVTPGNCSAFAAPDGAQQWQFGGETTSNGETTAVDGCLVLDGPRLVAGEVELGNLRLGGLITIEDLRASFEQEAVVEVPGPDGDKITISRTDMSLSATARVGDGAAKSFRGSASFANGGLTALELALPDLDLMNVVKLRDVEFSYVGATPWDDQVDTTFSLSGSVVGENTTSSFAGDVVFGEDGEVETLSIDAEDIDFGVFRIDLLSFSYDSLDDGTVWAVSGQVDVGGRPSSIAGIAAFEDGRVTAAELALEQLVIGDLAVINNVELSYTRGDDGAEEWSGSASVTADDGKTFAAGLGFAFDGEGSLESGFVEIERLDWSELLVFANVRFSYMSEDDSTRWDVSGSASIGGETTVLSGFIELEAGRATAGELIIENLRIGQIASIERLTLSAEVEEAATTWSASIEFDNDDETAGAGSMTWSDGRLISAQLDLANLRFSELFVLSDLSISLTAEEWSLSARLDNNDGANLVTSTLQFDDGRLVSAELTIQELSFGDLLVIDEFTLSYQNDQNGSSWRTSATVTVGDRTTSFSAIFVFQSNQLQAAVVTIGRVSWGEAIVMDDLTLTFDRTVNGTRWSLDGAIVIDGETTSVAGYLEFDDGRLVDGELSISNLRVGPLATIDELLLSYFADDAGSRFDADITFASGARASGSITWADGRLERASLDLSDLQLGQAFSMFDASMSYRDGNWTFDAFFSSDGNEVSLSGGLVFENGRLVDGTLNVGEIRVAGFSLTDFVLVLGDSIDFGGGPEAVADVCGVNDPGGPGDVYGISANISNESGAEGTFGGRLRVDDGVITSGVLCASNITIGEFVTLDDLLEQSTTQVAGQQVQETWSGSVDVVNPSAPDEPFSGSFEWVIRDGRTETLAIAASELRFSELLTFENVSFSYGRPAGVSRWAIAAELQRPNGNPGVAGSIELDGARVVAAELTITNVSFGNVLSLNDLTMTYVGRRAETSPPAQVFDNDGVFTSIPVGGCNETPDGSNVPSGPPSTTGAEAYFRIDAEVGVGASAVAAAGSIGLVDGRMSMFDVSISCLNLGDWLSLEDVRIGLSDQGDYLFQAAQGGASEADQRVTGRIEMDDGRVSGGRLTAANLSLGFVEVQEFKLTLGQQADGTSEWGATVNVKDPDGGTSFAGGGSVQLADGRVIGGTIKLPELPLLDVVPIENFSLGMERIEQNGNLRVSGAATIVGPDGSAAGSIDLLVIWSDGTLVAGSLQADEVEVFDVINGSSLSITYDRNAPGGPRWSGSMSTRVPGQSSSSIQMGFDVINGRLDSGIIGFDGDGDGEVDPTFLGRPPATGNGELAGFPLRAFHIRYCSADTNAAFCAGVDGPEWDGRLKVQLPSDNAPSLEAAVTIRNGRFVRAAIDLDLNPGVMIFSGVFLDSIGATLELDPRLRFCGSAGLSVGSPTIPIAEIEGGFEFSEGFNGIDSSTRSCDEPPVPFNVPDGTEADYYRFLIEAEAELFPNNPLGIDLTGTGYIDLWTSGYLGLGAELSASFWGNKLVVDAAVSGSVFDANNINATNPRNGEQLTGVQAQLSASAGVTALGASASGRFIVNTIGWSGCANTGVLGRRVGVSGYWDGGLRLGCSLDRVLLVVPGAAAQAAPAQTVAGFRGRSTVRADLVAVGLDADTSFDVAAGEQLLGIVMRSEGATPNTLVISPDGTVYEVSNDFGDQGPVTFTDGTEQIFIIEAPAAGTWTVRQVPGSPTVQAVEVYLGLPDVAVDATLRQDGSELSFDYALTEVAGQSVSFVERDSNGATVNLLGRIETPDTAVPTVTGQDSPAVLGSLAAAGTASGTISYRSNAAVEGGRHQLVALVEQDGLPRAEVVLATYEVAPATPASAPTAITAVASSEGASVSWEPPTDDGGRQIMAYHVSSDRGFIVAVDGDTRSVELPIPLMAPGETLNVYVRAFTAAGPGESGSATFTATAATEAVFEQPPQPQSFVIGGDGPVSPPSNEVLMVVGNIDAAGLPPVRDRPLLAQVEDLGLEVVLIDDDVAMAADAADKDLVIISSSVSPFKVGAEFRDVATPLLSWEAFLFDDLGFNTRGQRRNGETATRQSVVDIVDGSHPLSAGYLGPQPVATSKAKFSYSRPEGDPIIVGEVDGDAVIFGFDAGSAMAGELTAPARRVGFFTNYFVPPSLNEAGRDLFAAAVSWAIGGAGVPGNTAPIVEAGVDRSVSSNDAVDVALDATVDDDGRPVPPGGVVTVWSSSDAGVTFGDTGAVDTTVDLPGPGTYVLTLTADDSELQASDTVTITVVGDVPTGTQIAYVAGSTSPPPADRPIIAHLEAGGATVVVIDDDDAAAEDVSGFDLIFLSTSVVLSKVGDTFRDDEVPVITNEQFLLDDMDMARRLGSTPTRNIAIVDAGSPLAAGFTGDVRITTDLIPTGTANSAASADVIAEVGGQAALFAYDAGDEMVDAFAAPAARVFFPGTYRTGLNARADYFTLLDAAVVFALG